VREREWKTVGLCLHTIFGKRVLGGSTTHKEMMDGELMIFEEESRSSLVV